MGEGRLVKIINTIRYLKCSQLYYFLFYRVFKLKLFVQTELTLEDCRKFYFVKDNNTLLNKHFTFLNIEEKHQNICWNTTKHGLLWNYNLNYFNFLNQEDNVEEFLIEAILSDYVKNYKNLKFGRHPYPTSLRIVNLVKYHSQNKKVDGIEYLLINDTISLLRTIEYHIQGNHLLENAIALWFAAHVFKNKFLQQKAVSLLTKEINKQILEDGAHIELSTTYHSIILRKILEAISIADANPTDWNKKTTELLKSTASKMKSWIDHIAINKNYFPLINDSSYDVTPAIDKIFHFFKKLNITENKIKLNESGFRILSNGELQAVCDVSNILCSYQPGHSHADSLNFLLYIKDTPYIIDPGVSSYAKDIFRYNERSTMYHNTISINSDNSSQLYDVFKIGSRAKVKIISDESNFLKAEHDGFKKTYKSTHLRSWDLRNQSLIIHDYLSSDSRENKKYLNLHFHPNLTVKKINIRQYRINNLEVTLKGEILYANIEKYDCPIGFNIREMADKIVVEFHESIYTEFKIVE